MACTFFDRFWPNLKQDTLPHLQASSLATSAQSTLGALAIMRYTNVRFTYSFVR